MKRFIFTIVAIILFSASYGQNPIKQTEANYLFGFASMIHWHNYNNNEVIINVLGETVVTDYVNNLALTNTAGGRNVVARQASLSNLYNCNILFITSPREDALIDILSTPHPNVLIVFEGDEMLSFPADVSFKNKNTSKGEKILGYSVNLSSIKSKNFEVLPQFLGFGL